MDVSHTFNHFKVRTMSGFFFKKRVKVQSTDLTDAIKKFKVYPFTSTHKLNPNNVFSLQKPKFLKIIVRNTMKYLIEHCRSSINYPENPKYYKNATKLITYLSNYTSI